MWILEILWLFSKCVHYLSWRWSINESYKSLLSKENLALPDTIIGRALIDFQMHHPSLFDTQTHKETNNTLFLTKNFIFTMILGYMGRHGKNKILLKFIIMLWYCSFDVVLYLQSIYTKWRRKGKTVLLRHEK